MTSFETLSSVIRAFFALWSLALCLIFTINAILAGLKKRYRFTVFALVPFCVSYFLWQAIFDFSLMGVEGASGVTLAIVNAAWLIWLAVFFVLTTAAVLLFIDNIRYAKNYVTSSAIKSFLDEIPCGICCWRDNGRVLFSNVCVNRLCISLTGAPILNGNQFKDAVKDGILEVDGKLWRFTYRDIILGGDSLHEMIASDVTTVYTVTQALEKDKEELSRINSELKEYTSSIDETVRRQEILGAKINIHDEMNRLMLSTVAAESDDGAKLDEIFSLWEQNSLLLCMQSDDVADKRALTRLDELASALKINLCWESSIPSALSDTQRDLVITAAQEAIVNASKHARATTLTISFTESDKSISATFINDGVMPSGAVRMTGGLSNLERVAKERGATVSASADEKFVLTLTFSIENSPIG